MGGTGLTTAAVPLGLITLSSTCTPSCSSGTTVANSGSAPMPATMLAADTLLGARCGAGKAEPVYRAPAGACAAADLTDGAITWTKACAWLSACALAAASGVTPVLLYMAAAGMCLLGLCGSKPTYLSSPRHTATGAPMTHITTSNSIVAVRAGHCSSRANGPSAAAATLAAMLRPAAGAHTLNPGLPRLEGTVLWLELGLLGLN